MKRAVLAVAAAAESAVKDKVASQNANNRGCGAN
jgi:hypothetical protein